MTHRTAHPGFTLLELILVMVIIAVALSMAAPTLSNWSKGRELVNASDEFLSMTRYARSRAISNARMVMIQISDDGTMYRLMELDGMVFVEVEGYFRTLPEDFVMEIVYSNAPDVSSTSNQTAGMNGNVICFYPSGRCDPVRVFIGSVSDYTRQIYLDCGTPTELFRVVSAQ